MAGSLCPASLMERAKNQLNITNLSICYGQTETSPVNCQTYRTDPYEKQINSVGKPHYHTEIKIVDPQTKALVPRGVSGELCCKGYLVMKQYWSDPKVMV